MNLIEVENNKDVSRIIEQYSTYPVKFVKLETEFNRCTHIYLIGYGGGLVSGDESKIKISLKENAHLCIRTQGSTKIFKNVDNKSSVQSLNCILEENALLAYIPDQISVYADSNFSQKQILTLKKSSNVVFVDWFSCGRGVTRNELWDQNRTYSELKIYRDGEAILFDKFELSRDGLIPIADKVGNGENFGIIVLIGAKILPIIDNLNSMCKRESFRDVRSGIKRKSSKITENGNEYLAVENAPPIFSLSKIAHQQDAYILRFIGYNMESSYRFISDLLFPLHSEIGFIPYSDRILQNLHKI